MFAFHCYIFVYSGVSFKFYSIFIVVHFIFYFLFTIFFSSSTARVFMAFAGSGWRVVEKRAQFIVQLKQKFRAIVLIASDFHGYLILGRIVRSIVRPGIMWKLCERRIVRDLRGFCNERLEKISNLSYYGWVLGILNELG